MRSARPSRPSTPLHPTPNGTAQPVPLPGSKPAQALENDDFREQGADRLRDALDGLDARSREILEARWLGEKKATLQTLAARYGISAERVRQIEQTAIRTLRTAV